MRIIDFHTHIYPDAIAVKAADNVRGFYDGLGDSGVDGRVQTLLKYGDLAGISEFAVLPVAIKPDRTRHINEFICREVADQPRFYGFGTLHAAMDGLMDEVSFIMDNGLHGIKIHPDYQVFAIDDIRMYPVYEEIQGKLPIVFHMGDLRYDYSHPSRLKKVLKDFPKLQTVAAHFGGYQMREIACGELEKTNCLFDTSSSLMFMEPGLAESYIRRYGPERFLFGSDFPMWNPQIELERFMQLSLTDEEKEQIAWKTAAELLRV
ncbi:MAG: amidohydrolase [Ruminococcaceae bacterium]|nr:amidohydrolase [Oscillospiraceae bacterium]